VAPAAVAVWPQGVFDKWKRVDRSVKANNRTMSVGEFCTMLKAKQLLDYSELADCLKMEEAFEAFHLAHAATADHGEAAEAVKDRMKWSGTELIFIEYLEAIGRCAAKSVDESLGKEYASMPLYGKLVIFLKKLLS
jgi:hypothetical protein